MFLTQLLVQSIVLVHYTPILKNQIQVLRAILEHKADLLVLYNDDAGKEKWYLFIVPSIHFLTTMCSYQMVQQNPCVPDQDLQYHLNLITTLTSCCSGADIYDDVCQGLISMNEALFILNDSHLPLYFKVPYIVFFKEACSFDQMFV